MARTSKLTPAQWDEIIRRHIINGESIRSLAAEFNIAESAVRSYIKAHKQKIQNAANQIVITTDAISDLSINAQITAHSLAHQIMAMRSNSIDSGVAMSAVAKRISKAAQVKVEKMIDEELMTEPMMKGIMASAVVVNAALRPALEFMAVQAREREKADEGDGKREIILIDAPDA